MSFSEAPRPPQPAADASGVSMSMSISSRGVKKVRFTINAAAQERLFKASIAGKKAKVLIGSGDDEGLAQIRLSDTGESEFTSTVKGGACVVVGHWIALPNDKRPAAQCDVIASNGGTITLRLPEWTKPNGAGGKLDKTQQRPKAPVYKS